jgi:primosomal protein N' (replication factor Y) (superfamily II helicase)
MPHLISVAVPVPFLDLLTYHVPDDIALPVRGARVLVPLGSRVLTGIVVGAGARADEPAVPIKAIVDVLDDAPFLPEGIVDLTMWMAEYYACGAGEAIAVAMPPKAVVQSDRSAQITASGLEWRSARADSPVVSLKARILEALSVGRPMSVGGLGARLRKVGGTEAGRVAPVNATIRALERDGLVTVSQPLRGQAAAHQSVRIATLTAEGHDPQVPLGRRQREALGLLRGTELGLALPALSQRGVTAETIQRLVTRGLVTVRRERVERDPFMTVQGDWDIEPVEPGRILTDEQAKAFEDLKQLALSKRFAVSLVHGVTGSGKTEVYLRLADVVRAAGRSVLVLVPEIALTPAVAAAFRGTFGNQVAIQHSGLSDGERYDQWQRIRRGEVSIVVGTRSAVFAPLASLGLIVVDEEHDGSFKQEETPRYHGRDVAVMRGKQEDALVVLGSATPSLESYQNARMGRYARVGLERRVLDRPLANVRTVNMQEEYAAHGPDVILSEPLKLAIEERLVRREQVLVLLNRRGLATAVFCRQCTSTLECPNCSVSLIVHTEGRDVHRARCHYCNYATVVPKACPLCAGPYMEQVGFGTERVEAEIAAAWPGARVARLDRDIGRRRGAAAALLARVARGEIDVLVGTQMIAKGHDFPRVTLVGVISADVGLGLADFRAAERTFQLLTQVAGRAGRGEQPGEAIVQTLYPDHYSVRHACRQDYESFFDDEIRYRRAMRYPPIVALVNAIVRAPTYREAMADAADLAERLRQGAGAGQYRVLGPAPAPLARLRGEYRAQLFLKGARRRSMRDALRAALAARPECRRRVTIDVDPLSML